MNIYKMIIYIFFLIYLQTSSAEQNHKIFWQCDENSCDLYAKLNDSKIMLVSKGWELDVSDRSSYTTYNDKLGSMFVSCGMRCCFTTFVNFASGEVSIPFYDVFAVIPEKEVIVTPDKVFENTVEIRKIFNSNNKSQKITSDFYGGPDYAIYGASFYENKLYMNYYAGDEGDIKVVKTTFIDYEKLEEIDFSKLFPIINYFYKFFKKGSISSDEKIFLVQQ